MKLRLVGLSCQCAVKCSLTRPSSLQSRLASETSSLTAVVGLQFDDFPCRGDDERRFGEDEKHSRQSKSIERCRFTRTYHRGSSWEARPFLVLLPVCIKLSIPTRKEGVHQHHLKLHPSEACEGRAYTYEHDYRMCNVRKIDGVKLFLDWRVSDESWRRAESWRREAQRVNIQRLWNAGRVARSSLSEHSTFERKSVK